MLPFIQAAFNKTDAKMLDTFSGPSNMIERVAIEQEDIEIVPSKPTLDFFDDVMRKFLKVSKAPITWERIYGDTPSFLALNPPYNQVDKFFKETIKLKKKRPELVLPMMLLLNAQALTDKSLKDYSQGTHEFILLERRIKFDKPDVSFCDLNCR